MVLHELEGTQQLPLPWLVFFSPAKLYCWTEAAVTKHKQFLSGHGKWGKEDPGVLGSQAALGPNSILKDQLSCSQLGRKDVLLVGL